MGWRRSSISDSKFVSDGKTVQEVALEKSGDINALQRYRQSVIPRTADEFEFPVMSLIGTDHSLRATVQREIRLNEKLSEKYGDIKKRAEIGQQLLKLNRDYWYFAQKRWQYQSALPIGPLTRALDLWRSHPRWYMHEFLVKDCAGKGGCCGRDCGCCVNRPINLKRRKLGVGHCTAECGCCAEARGFELTGDDKRTFKTRFDISAGGPFKHYRHASVQILIFGTLETQITNPFDMIYTPPQLKHKCVSVPTWTSSKPIAKIDEGECSDMELSTGEIIDLGDI